MAHGTMCWAEEHAEAVTQHWLPWQTRPARLGGVLSQKGRFQEGFGTKCRNSSVASSLQLCMVAQGWDRCGG